jgi:hypothetical protein
MQSAGCRIEESCAGVTVAAKRGDRGLSPKPVDLIS